MEQKFQQTPAVASTAKIVVTMKNVGKEPAFWQTHANKAGKRTEPLFKNDYMKLFVDLESEKKVAAMKNQPLSTAVRERYFRQAISRSVKNPEDPIKQIVILGSGYDTRAVRKKKYNVKFFEIDYDAILENKNKIYQTNQIDDSHVFYIKMDYLKENWIEKFKEHNIDFNQPTHFVWEGNIMYFEKREDVDKIIELIKNNFSSFTISLDYVHTAFLEGRVENPEVKAASERCRQQGSWKTGLENIGELTNKHGLKLIDDQTIGKLQKEYEIDEKPSETTEYYSVCSMTNNST